MKSTCISYALTCLFLISSFAHAQPSLRYLNRIINLNSLGDMQAHGDYAYVVSAPPQGKLSIKIVDLSDPAQPKIAGEYISDASSYSCFEGCVPHRMSLDWPFLYLPVSDGLEIVNLENPALPMLAGKFPRTMDFSQWGVVSARDGLAVWAPFNRDFHILDVTNPSSPQPLALLNPSLEVDNSRYLTKHVLLEHPYVYLLGDVHPEGTPKTGGDAIFTLDISNPKEWKSGDLIPLPITVSDQRIPSIEPDFMIKIGDWLYLHIGNDGFYKVDVSNPMQPVLVPSTKYARYVNGLYLQNNYLFVSSDTRLAVFEIQSGDPVLVTEISRSAYGVVAGDKFILAKVGYPSVLQTFELSHSSGLPMYEEYK